MFWRQRTAMSSSPSVTPNELLEILLAHTYGYYVLPAEPYDEVFTNIYLGDSTTALCIHLLKRLGITHVLNAAWGKQRHLGLVNTSAEFYRNAQIEFMGVEALDMSVFPLYHHFKSAADFIEQALKQPNGKVLVHCGEGISRSSTLVIAYLMIKRGFTVQDAVRTVVKHRNILPNQGFLMQLCHLNDELLRDGGQRYNQPQPQPSEHVKPVQQTLTPSSYDEDYTKMTGSSRSPTPNYQASGRSMTPSPFNRSYSSASTNTETSTSSTSYSNRNQHPQHYYPPSSSSTNRTIQQIQRRQDFRRAQSCERPSYITRGSSYLSKSTSTASACKRPSSPSSSPSGQLFRSQYHLNNNNYHSHYNNNHHNAYYNSSTSTGYNHHQPHYYNHSLMTTYLVNRPMPCMSR